MTGSVNGDGRVVVCEYGGVLTNPLADTFAMFEFCTGISGEQIGRAMALAQTRHGVQPMAELETGRITEARFLELLTEGIDGGPQWLADSFATTWFAGRRANVELVIYLRELRARGHRLALLTNNVREWEPLWRATIPVDDLFEIVVNSAHEGTRKPDPEIYRRLLERLGVAPRQCLFLDELEENCAVARRLGMAAVRFEDNEQAIAALEQHLMRSAA